MAKSNGGFVTKTLDYMKENVWLGWLTLILAVGTVLRVVKYTYDNLTSPSGSFNFPELLSVAFGVPQPDPEPEAAVRALNNALYG